MSEIYWLTRLDGLCLVVGFIIAILAAIAFVNFMSYLTTEYRNDAPKYLKTFRNSLIGVFVASFVQVFIPNTKEAFLIYGVGSTIDYLKANEKVNQLPDKCIDYLNAWVDQITKEKQ